jgi:hypothetical protein
MNNHNWTASQDLGDLHFKMKTANNQVWRIRKLPNGNVKITLYGLDRVFMTSNLWQASELPFKAAALDNGGEWHICLKWLTENERRFFAAVLGDMCNETTN